MVFAPLADGQSVANAGQRLYIYPLLPYPLLGGVSSTTGAALHWAWQALYEDQTPFDAAIQQALATPAGAEGVFFLPFLSGERTPFWNDALRGAFYGLTLTHRRSHLLRAVLEGVAFSLRYLLDEFARVNIAIDAIALAGGGAAITGLPQLVADVCARPVAVYAGEETVTRALYAYACQALDGEDFVSALGRTFGAPEVFAPSRAIARRYADLYAQYCQLAEFANVTLAQNPTEPRP
jgi:sugar (pentulose or hexulose) kinase